MTSNLPLSKTINKEHLYESENVYDVMYAYFDKLNLYKPGDSRFDRVRVVPGKNGKKDSLIVVPNNVHLPETRDKHQGFSFTGEEIWNEASGKMINVDQLTPRLQDFHKIVNNLAKEADISKFETIGLSVPILNNDNTHWHGVSITNDIASKSYSYIFLNSLSDGPGHCPNDISEAVKNTLPGAKETSITPGFLIQGGLSCGACFVANSMMKLGVLSPENGRGIDVELRELHNSIVPSIGWNNQPAFERAADAMYLLDQHPNTTNIRDKLLNSARENDRMSFVNTCVELDRHQDLLNLNLTNRQNDLTSDCKGKSESELEHTLKKWEVFVKLNKMSKPDQANQFLQDCNGLSLATLKIKCESKLFDIAQNHSKESQLEQNNIQELIGYIKSGIMTECFKENNRKVLDEVMLLKREGELVEAQRFIESDEFAMHRMMMQSLDDSKTEPKFSLLEYIKEHKFNKNQIDNIKKVFQADCRVLSLQEKQDINYYISGLKDQENRKNIDDIISLQNNKTQLVEKLSHFTSNEIEKQILQSGYFRPKASPELREFVDSYQKEKKIIEGLEHKSTLVNYYCNNNFDEAKIIIESLERGQLELIRKTNAYAQLSSFASYEIRKPLDDLINQRLDKLKKLDQLAAEIYSAMSSYNSKELPTILNKYNSKEIQSIKDHKEYKNLNEGSKKIIDDQIENQIEREKKIQILFKPNESLSEEEKKQTEDILKNSSVYELELIQGSSVYKEKVKEQTPKVAVITAIITETIEVNKQEKILAVEQGRPGYAIFGLVDESIVRALTTSIQQLKENITGLFKDLFVVQPYKAQGNTKNVDPKLQAITDTLRAQPVTPVSPEKVMSPRAGRSPG